MKSKTLGLFLSIAAIIFGASPALATFVSTVPGMDSTNLSYTNPFGGAHRSAVESDIENQLELGLLDVFFVGRTNNVFDSSTQQSVQELFGLAPLPGGGTVSLANTLTVKCTEPSGVSGCIGGTWSFAPPSALPGLVIAYVEIAAAGKSNLYKLSDFGVSGVWNSYNFPNANNVPNGVSHMDFYSALSSSPPTSVPEPVSLGLLGLGGALVAGGRWRRRGRIAQTS